jgi:hypothetical protein
VWLAREAILYGLLAKAFGNVLGSKLEKLRSRARRDVERDGVRGERGAAAKCGKWVVRVL